MSTGFSLGLEKDQKGRSVIGENWEPLLVEMVGSV